MLHSLDRPSARVIGWDDQDDDTVELELNESALRALTEAAALALAAFEERKDPRLTPGANTRATRGFEPETLAEGRGATTLEHEAAAARQASVAFEQEAPSSRQAGEAVEPETPAGRHASEAFEQKAPSSRQVAEALEQETPAVAQRSVTVARAPRKSRPFALGLGMVAAAGGLLGGLAYLATARAPHPIPIVADSGSRPTVAPKAATSVPASAPVPAPPATSAPPATPDVPVRFKNPFDASEVFEFPAGTSWTEMRDAVAELLSQRARERQSLFVKRSPRNTKTADRNASATASRVTPRS